LGVTCAIERAIPGLAYGRVDLVGAQLGELEPTEPELFFRFAPEGTVEAFVDEVLVRVARAQPLS
jgi:hypothetical protein